MKKAFLLAFLAILLFASSVMAVELLDVEKAVFKRYLKEYSCKTIYPSLRHENKDLAKYDMSNLRAKIILGLSNNVKGFDYLNEFISENPDYAEGLEVFVKLVSEKRKYELLQDNKYDFRKIDENISYNSNGKKPILGLGEWIRFKYSFNLPPEKIDYIIKNKTENISRTINEEYGLILNDYRNITDKETLAKYGPSVIERSERLLTGDDPGLYDSYGQDLYVMAGNCRVGLDLDLSTTPREVVAKYYVDYIKRVYSRVKIPVYKYYSLFAVSQMLESVTKYEELLDYCTNVKKDVYLLLPNLYQLRLTLLICRLVVEKCPVKPEYYKIGQVNYIDLIIDIDDLEGYTPEEKRMLKLYFQANTRAELYEKYLFHNEAVDELDYVIASPPPVIPAKETRDDYWLNFHKDLVKQAGTRRDQIIPNVNIKVELIVSSVVGNDPIKKVYIDIKDEAKNVCDLLLKVTTTTGNVIPKSFSLELSYDDTVDKFFDENVQPFFDKYKIDSLRGKNFGFVKDNTISKKIILREVGNNPIKLVFKYSGFSGDVFNIVAIATAPYKSEASIQIQTWKRFTLNFYAMKDPNGKNLYPDYKVIEKGFNPCCIGYSVNNYTQVSIPYHEKIFVGKKDELPEDQFAIVDFINETKKDVTYNVSQNEYVNIIGCYSVYFRDSENNNAITSGFGCYYRILVDELLPLKDYYFNTILMAYSHFRLDEGKTINHEFGHSFGLRHPGTGSIFPYTHEENCYMHSGQEGIIPTQFCKYCSWIIRNSYVNNGVLEIGPQKKLRR